MDFQASVRDGPRPPKAQRQYSWSLLEDIVTVVVPAYVGRYDNPMPNHAGVDFIPPVRDYEFGYSFIRWVAVF